MSRIWEEEKLLLLLHLFNGLFFQDNLGKPAPEKQNHSGKTNLDLLEQEIVSGSGISWGIEVCRNYGSWFSCLEDVSSRYEPSNIVALFFLTHPVYSGSL